MTMRERMARRIATRIEGRAETRTGLGVAALADLLLRAGDIEDLLDNMRGDPGHDVTEGLVEPMGDRTAVLAIWNHMLDRIRAGA